MSAPQQPLSSSNPSDSLWFIDPTCIGCGLCVEVAGAFVQMDFAAGMARVVRQPSVQQEAELIRARRECPVDAIHEPPHSGEEQA